MSAEWRDPPSEPYITANQVHVWFCDFRGVDEVGSAADCLSSDEQSRAEWFHQEEDRLVFQASHIFLRSLLGLYMGLRPSEVSLRTGCYGKPELATESPTLSFNLTHSHRSAAFAITDGAAVGIDMEAIDPRRFDEPTAEQVLSKAEMDHLRRLGPNEQLAAFFPAWTRKEAYAKCEGLGLSLDVRTIELGLKAGPLEYGETTLVTSETPNQCLLTLAVKHSNPVVEYWQVPAGRFL